MLMDISRHLRIEICSDIWLKQFNMFEVEPCNCPKPLLCVDLQSSHAFMVYIITVLDMF